MEKKLLFILLFTFFVSSVFGQGDSFQERMIKKEIPSENIKNLEKAEDFLFEVTLSENKIIKNDQHIYKLQEKNNTSSNKKEIKINEKKITDLQKESRNELIKIANLYYANYKICYTVYRDQLVRYQTTDRYKRLKVNELISDSKVNKSTIRLIVEDISQIKNYQELKKELIKINLLRVEGIDKLNEAFCTYINCYELITTVENKYIKIENNKIEIASKYNVIFKVQILAVSKKRNIYKLQEKYKKIAIVEETYSKELKLYRYMIGEFKDYYNAKDFSENIETRGAFVVSFINGKRANIEEAIAKSEMEY